MEEKIYNRLVRGLGANAYNQIITVVVQLIGVPILLHAWGTRMYGEWLVLSAVPTYLSMTDLGFSQSAANEMTAQVARGDYESAASIFKSLSVLVYGVVCAGLVITAALFADLPLTKWLHLELLSAREAATVVWLLAAQVFASLPNGLNHAGYRANGAYALDITLNSTTRLLQFSSIWVVALTGGGPVLAAAAFCAIRVIGTLAISVLLLNRYTWLRMGRRRSGHLRELARPAVANMAMPLAQALNIQGLVLVIGATIGPLSVVVFSTLRTLTRLALQLVLSVSNAAEPELASAYGSENKALARSIFIHTLRASLWLALIGAAGLAIFGSLILKVWTNGKVAMDSPLFACLLASSVASVLWYGALTALRSANKHLPSALAYLLASAAVVAVSAALLHTTGGLLGAGGALLCMDATMAVTTWRAANPLLGTLRLTDCVKLANPAPLLALAKEKTRSSVSTP